MGLQGKQMIQILVVFVLITLGTAQEVEKGKLGQCLGKCGDDVVSCVVGCHVEKVQNFLGCALKCEGANKLCMSKCASTNIPPIGPHPAPPRA